MTLRIRVLCSIEASALKSLQKLGRINLVVVPRTGTLHDLGEAQCLRRTFSCRCLPWLVVGPHLMKVVAGPSAHLLQPTQKVPRPQEARAADSTVSLLSQISFPPYPSLASPTSSVLTYGAWRQNLAASPTCARRRANCPSRRNTECEAPIFSTRPHQLQPRL